jgi:hypothetical protein
MAIRERMKTVRANHSTPRQWLLISIATVVVYSSAVAGIAFTRLLAGLAAICCSMPLCAQTAAQPSSSNSSILVELFTSEGCSSCPPADELLAKIDGRHMPDGQSITILGEHVDYWDGQGWRDRFSSRVFTERQQEYARRFQIPEPYTPEVIVDGAQQFVGNNPKRLQDALTRASAQPKTQIQISIVGISNKEISFHVHVDPLPSPHRGADLMAALAENSDDTQVRGGENKGRVLHHAAPVLAIDRLGKVHAAGADKDFSMHIPKMGIIGNMRLVVFVQAPDYGIVLGSNSAGVKSSGPQP